MYGVIPAAGEGTRLRPLTADKPKGLVDIAGNPLLSHVFQTAIYTGVERLIVVIGYKGDKIVEYYGDSFEGTPITYVHQSEQRGLGHAVLQTKSHIHNDFIVFNGDNVFGQNPGYVLDESENPDVSGVLVVEEVSRDEAQTTGVVETRNGTVKRLAEKPSDPVSTVVTTGFYVLPLEIFHALDLINPSDRGEYELTDAVNLMVKAGHRFEVVPLEGRRVNVNSLTDIEQAEQILEEKD